MKTDRKRAVLTQITLGWIVAMVGFVFCSGTGLAQNPKPLVLIKTHEAALSDAPAEERALSVLDTKEKKGPIIIVKSPKNGETYALPLKIEMEFVPQPDAEIDLSSLKVLYIKIFNIDITERVKPYATEKGILIPEAKIPKGNHKITIRIADTSGNVSSENLKFVVQ
jgi:hypothetical protein